MVTTLAWAASEWAAIGGWISALASTGTLIVAISTASRALREFRHRRTLDAYQTYKQYVDKTTVPEWYEAVSKAVRDPDDVKAALVAVGHNNRRLFLAHIEGIALLINSDLVPEEVAFYTFGTTVLDAFAHPDELWEKIHPNRDDSRWVLAHDLYFRFRKLNQKKPKYHRDRVRFGSASLWKRWFARDANREPTDQLTGATG